MTKVKDKRLGYFRRALIRHRLVVKRSAPVAEDVVIALTTYGDRLEGVDITIRSLLAQTRRAAHIILYVAENEISRLPGRLRRLCDERFEIQAVEDIKSYKKIIPALRWLSEADNPYRWLIICDDDVVYPTDWLEGFRLETRGEGCAVAHRCHVVSYDRNGDYLPYKFWKMNVVSPGRSIELFATGCGGVAIPFGKVEERFFNTDIWQSLADGCDDVWVNLMLKGSGISLEQSGYRFPLLEWTPKGARKLWRINRMSDDDGLSRNDKALLACRRYLLESGFDA